MALGAWVPSALLYLKSQPPSYHFAGIHMLRNLGSTLYLTERNGEQEVITPAPLPRQINRCKYIAKPQNDSWLG